MKKYLSLVVVFFVLITVSCSKKKQAMKEVEAREEIENIEHVVEEEVREDDFIEEEDYDIVKNNTDFAFELFQQFAENRKNLVLSPYSVSSALAMTYAGAKGITEMQMSEVLHFTRSKLQVHQGFKNLNENIQKTEPKQDPQLSISNLLWAQENYGFLDEFYHSCKKYYGSGFQYMDFKNQPDQSLSKINEWVEQQTNNKIVNLLPEGSITKETRLVLTNAIWFYGKWLIPFEIKHSEINDFTTEDGGNLRVKFMNHPNGQFNYVGDVNMQVLELPYEGKKFSMLIFLPGSTSSLKELEQEFTAEFYKNTIRKLRASSLEVTIPQFKFTSQAFLNKNLIDMGMVDAFSDQADFSGMTGARDLMIDKVIHKAFIEVNEKGTEAAGATAVVMMERSSYMEEKPVFNANHPFLFLIKDNENGSIIFIGRVFNPLVN